MAPMRENPKRVFLRRLTLLRRFVTRNVLSQQKGR